MTNLDKKNLETCGSYDIIICQSLNSDNDSCDEDAKNSFNNT